MLSFPGAMAGRQGKLVVDLSSVPAGAAGNATLWVQAAMWAGACHCDSVAPWMSRIGLCGPNPLPRGCVANDPLLQVSVENGNAAPS